MPPAGLRGAAPLAAVALLVLGAPLALAGEDCLWYLDRNGSWHPGFNCEFFTFCCGTCYQRYCCRDLSLLITERQQKHCLAFSPKTIAGIASAVILFVAVVATTICCFLCSCCYLYRRRQQLQSPFEGNARAGPGARATSSALHVQKTCACTQAQTWPGDPHDRRPCAASVPIPPGPQSRPCTPTAWLHVPTQRSCTPVSTLPSGTPRLQPCSSSPVHATPALLPWSLRSQLRLCRPSGD
ncbi:protein shisa-4 isoform X3 [Cervus elaphus]|uniref:protein shisa-4 isoform X3 n=1 Tax=Cervus canadensis TaxID=1574408 RepID=UPI001C9E6C25|nr:protein shisa-4 isoform X3 [Cervus canadensis]XP_043779094.1 protein shisa-4 isoform X3 [Cervus elaphus]